MSQSAVETRPAPAGHFVVESETGRLLAGVGHNPHRAWVFPLNTPRGLGVVQEYAFDHPFHNGVFVGQGLVKHAGKISNFWAPAPDWRQPNNHIFHHIGVLRYREPALVEPRNQGFRFTYKTVWCDEDLQPVLDELRMIDIYNGADGTICDVVSTKSAAYGPLEFGANKHGSIGLRVQPQLLPVLGGQILSGMSGELRRGLADEVANEKSCDYVAYESDVPGLGRFGVCLAVLEHSASSSRSGPWFIRDYGMAMFNATMNEAIHTPAGESWTAGLRVIAYDRALTESRASAWLTL